jgi:hypothetical protein
MKPKSTEVPFLTTEDGNLQCARHFLSPRVTVTRNILELHKLQRPATPQDTVVTKKSSLNFSSSPSCAATQPAEE